MFGNISQILEMRKKAQELKSKLEGITITEEYKGITIDCNGNRKVLAIHIDNNAYENKSNLEENLKEAINLALEKAEKASFGEIGNMAGGMEGLANLFGK